MKINERQFIDELAEIIEADPSSLTLESDFRKSCEFWSSLTGFGILIFMQDRLGVRLEVDDFLRLNTIGELYALTAE